MPSDARPILGEIDEYYLSHFQSPVHAPVTAV